MAFYNFNADPEAVDGEEEEKETEEEEEDDDEFGDDGDPF